MTLQLLFGGGQRLASGGQLRADLVDGLFELSAAPNQLSDYRCGVVAFGELDFGGQPLRISLQALGKVFEIGDITTPFLAFPAMRGQKVVLCTHSAALLERMVEASPLPR